MARWTLSAEFISTKVLCAWNNIREVRPSSLPPRSQLCYQLPPSTTGQPAVFGVPLCQVGKNSPPFMFTGRFVRLRSGSSLCAFAPVSTLPPLASNYTFCPSRFGYSPCKVSCNVRCRWRKSLQLYVFCPAPFDYIPTSITRPVTFAYSCSKPTCFLVYWLTGRSSRLPRVQPP